MNLSRKAKSVLAVGVVAGLLLYLLLLDLGVNAGRIHYGVTVGGLDVGGLTMLEAVEKLDGRGEELRDEPVIFTREGFDCRFTPAELGWAPLSNRAAGLAEDVGRVGGPFDALSERVRAWFSGVDVEWPDRPGHRKLKSLIDECERQAEGLGLELDRTALRRRIRRAIVTWPRRFFEIPLVTS